MILIIMFTCLLSLLSAWDLLFEYACDRFIDIEDPDDWEGREDEWCQAQIEYACNFADERVNEDTDDAGAEEDWEDDDDCTHPSSTQSSDGAYYCDTCHKITYDISDEEFAQQHGDNFQNSDFQGW